MDTGSFGIGLGIGLALGVVIGVTIMIVMKSTENSANSGVMYTYDDKDRLQTMAPMAKNVQLVAVKSTE